MIEITHQINNLGKFNIAFSSKSDGNMQRNIKNRNFINQTRESFLKKNNVNLDKFTRIRATHSPNIAIQKYGESIVCQKLYRQTPIVDTNIDFYYDGCDGILTFDTDIAIGLMSGDCIPLIIWDNTTNLHGIIHVGLLGGLNNIVKLLLPIFRDNNVDISNTNYYLGPSISVDDYNLNKSGLWNTISEQAIKKVPTIGNFMKKNQNGSFINLEKLLINQLVMIGINPNQIQKSEITTSSSNSPYFSHFRSKFGEPKGRFFTIIR